MRVPRISIASKESISDGLKLLVVSGCVKTCKFNNDDFKTILTSIRCGSGLMGAASYFYNSAGLSPGDSYSLQLGQFGLGIVGVLVSWWAMTYVGK